MSVRAPLNHVQRFGREEEGGERGFTFFCLTPPPCSPNSLNAVQRCPLHSDPPLSSASRISRPIEFHEGQVAPQEAARIGWLALREVMRSWGIVSREGLTQWLQREGFQAVQPGNHIGARAQEVLLGRACSEDARVALLESVYVPLVLHTGRETRVEPALAATEAPLRDSVLGGWAQLDEVDLQEELLNRVAMLKSCPHFLRGRMRECFAVALRRDTVPSWRETFCAKPEHGNCSVWFRRCCCTVHVTLAALAGTSWRSVF